MNKFTKKFLLVFLSTLNLYSQTLFSKASFNINKILDENKVKYIMFSFCDLLGNLKEVTMPCNKAKEAIKDGLAFDGSSVLGYSSITQSDLILKPDISSFRICPWTKIKNKTAIIICDIFKDINTPLESCPRFILKKVIKKAQDLNYKFYVGPEIEFFLNNSNNQKYFDPAISIKEQKWKLKLLKTLIDLNIEVEKIHHEVADGQYEVSLKYNNPIEIGDQIIIAKYAIKLLAENYGLRANFMPKVDKSQNGSGMHIHYSLFNIQTNKNIFYNSENSNLISDLAKQFLSGNLTFISDISSLFNSTVNSYKRLVPGYEAPIYIGWGYSNRSTLIRIPKLTIDNPNAARAEIRCPDALCNPYLAFAGLLYSGLKGLESKLDSFDPIETNLYKLSSKEKAKIKALPNSLDQAINNLKNSNFAKELLGESAYKAFIKIKKQECREYNTSVTNWEKKYYS